MQHTNPIMMIKRCIQHIVLIMRRLVYCIDLWADFSGEADHKKLAIGTFIYFWNLGEIKVGRIAGYSKKLYIVHSEDSDGAWEYILERKACIKCIRRSTIEIVK